jgi:hypothetical protein
MFGVRRHEAVIIGQKPRGNHQQQRGELLYFHKAKRLGNVATRGQLKLLALVVIRTKFSAPAYSSVASLPHGLGGPASSMDWR